RGRSPAAPRARPRGVVLRARLLRRRGLLETHLEEDARGDGLAAPARGLEAPAFGGPHRRVREGRSAARGADVRHLPLRRHDELEHDLRRPARSLGVVDGRRESLRRRDARGGGGGLVVGVRDARQDREEQTPSEGQSPEKTAPEKTAPEETAPEETAPENTTPPGAAAPLAAQRSTAGRHGRSGSRGGSTGQGAHMSRKRGGVRGQAGDFALQWLRSAVAPLYRIR